LSNPIRKRSATAVRLMVLLTTGWAALVVARPWAAASFEASFAAPSGEGSRASAGKSAGTNFKPDISGAIAVSAVALPREGSAVARRIAGRSDHAGAHITINFSALARDETRGAFAPARRHRGVRPQGNPFMAAPAFARRHGAHRKKAPTPTPTADPAGGALNGFPGLGDNNTVIPPDTDGAVGPAHLVVALNSQIEIQTRT
jgi:hypothetical protein